MKIGFGEYNLWMMIRKLCLPVQASHGLSALMVIMDVNLLLYNHISFTFTRCHNQTVLCCKHDYYQLSY